MKKSILLGVLVGSMIINTHGMTDELISYDRYYGVVETVEKEYKEIDIELSFYTGLVIENTKYGAVDAQGNDLVWGTIAGCKSIELGTQVEIDLYPNQVFTVKDRGNSKYIKIEDGVYHFDVYCQRKQGESDSDYYKRVNNYGRIQTKGRILL